MSCPFVIAPLWVLIILILDDYASGGKPVRVVSIVVVDIPTGIHITRIVRITNVRRTEPPIPNTTIALNIFIYIFYIYCYQIVAISLLILSYLQQVVSNTLFFYLLYCIFHKLIALDLAILLCKIKL